jgi:4-hydroxyproline epimerase
MTTSEPQLIKVIDSHTGGEPTRVVIDGFPDLGGGSLTAQRDCFRQEFDHLRAAIVTEPRGHAAVVGALLLPPVTAGCDAAVIFFNNVGLLGMCGHGMIGVVRTLEFLGRTSPGEIRIETPAGIVTAELNAAGEVTITNVPSYRFRQNVAVDVPDFGAVTGDIAWGGNWFFLINEHEYELSLANLTPLMNFTTAVKNALAAAGITGHDGAAVDHIELFSPTPTADSRNFVLCPGNEYDRSPCGTGTSAKLACLLADGKIKEGQVWHQESIIGSIFKGSVRRVGDAIIPRISGTAFVTAETTLILDPNDPFRFGFGG